MVLKKKILGWQMIKKIGKNMILDVFKDHKVCDYFKEERNVCDDRPFAGQK